MIETVIRKRIEILSDTALVRRVTEAIDRAGIEAGEIDLRGPGGVGGRGEGVHAGDEEEGKFAAAAAGRRMRRRGHRRR